jgi:dTDP-4-dehydrorhamnose 3,5-epimerase
MIFTPLTHGGTATLGDPGLPAGGPIRIELERHEDARGFFARALCAEEFATHGLPAQWPQANLSFNTAAGTVRGLHFQRAPAAEAKLVRCIRGAIFDVIIDLRAGSPAYGQWVSAEIDAGNRSMIYVPAGFGHGFQTLEPDTELLYFHDAMFSASHQGGLNALDPALGIPWPRDVVGLSPRDAALPALSDLEPLRP